MDVWSRKDTLYCELNALYGVQNPGYFQATTRYIAPPAMMHGKARGVSVNLAEHPTLN